VLPKRLDADASESALVEKIIKRMCKNMGPKFPYSPRIMAKVLAGLDEELPWKLIREWPLQARALSEQPSDPDSITAEETEALDI
jgi:hypothetical protein